MWLMSMNDDGRYSNGLLENGRGRRLWSRLGLLRCHFLFTIVACRSLFVTINPPFYCIQLFCFFCISLSLVSSPLHSWCYQSSFVDRLCSSSGNNECWY
ncbi:hypothetical protein BDP27DRAFT_517034 [Rhodocollybia butyracea]|uniref:Transmembrane protein n=1 Tax=Rhodocollybia butyracea TaxID=206335 RepID=A0A9P5Q018_9AGAR|nr:hypothetical protein BDP27DRAFT_517034 [Rhodocollybia butyracea]